MSEIAEFSMHKVLFVSLLLSILLLTGVDDLQANDATTGTVPHGEYLYWLPVVDRTAPCDMQGVHYRYVPASQPDAPRPRDAYHVFSAFTNQLGEENLSNLSDITLSIAVSLSKDGIVFLEDMSVSTIPGYYTFSLRDEELAAGQSYYAKAEYSCHGTRTFLMWKSFVAGPE